MDKFVRYKKIFRLYELVQPYLKYSLHVDKGLPGSSIVVLAPHPDDEAIGCGGSISMAAASGKKVTVVYLTLDTSAREKEALRSLDVLGISGKRFLGYKVESLRRQRTLADRIAEVLSEERPDTVLLPFMLDNHIDHIAANKAFAACGKRLKRDLTVYGYPVWSPVYPNAMIDISGAWEKKKRAIECYASQLSGRDYVEMSYSLSRYWALAKGGKPKLAETFFRLSFGEYLSMVKKLLG